MNEKKTKEWKCPKCQWEYHSPIPVVSVSCQCGRDMKPKWKL